MSKILYTAAWLALCMCLNSCNNRQPAPGDTSAGAAKPPVNPALIAGQQIYEKNCVACHGEDGTAGIGGAANFKTLQADSLTMVQTVSQGKHNMPGFGERFKAGQIQQVIEYVKSLHQ